MLSRPDPFPSPSDNSAAGRPARLLLTGITKRYPSVVANDAVTLSVLPGEIHAVLGENGAGKSTLMKIIYGSLMPDAGRMFFDGLPVRIRNPRQARELGIAMVFQHFSLFDTLSVAENVWLGLDHAAPLEEVTESIRSKGREYGLDIDPHRPVHTLSVGEMQRVEIIRALLTNPRLLILDEPTSVLTPQAVEQLFRVLRQLAQQDCSILYISHKLDEIRQLCDTCTVLRAGRVTGVYRPAQESNASLSRLMIGAEPPQLPERTAQAGEIVLRVRGLNLPPVDPQGVHLHYVDMDVRAGEIVGIAGVSGNGQQELLYALSGENADSPVSSIKLLGQDVSRMGPAQRRALGLHFVPEERLGRGAVPSMDLAHNMLLTRTDAVSHAGWLHLSQLEEQARDVITNFGVKAAGPHALAQSLSGGNLQKFIVGREIGAHPRLFIVSQPTWGVDVGAAAQIRAAILALRDAGCAVLLVSEDLQELFELSDRLYVISQGALSPCLARRDASVEKIGLWMSGLWHTDTDTAHQPYAFTVTPSANSDGQKEADPC